MVVESRTSAINEICDQILLKLESKNFGQDNIFAVHLALQEAFINAIKHGNKMDPAKEVKIEYSITDEKIEISITDEGGGFDPDSVPDPRSEENLYKTEGRGLFLICSYMDTVDFNNGGNCMHMVKYKSE